MSPSHYRLLRLLGAGASGAVYEAERVGDGERFAVRVYPEGVRPPETTWAEVRHRAVIPVRARLRVGERHAVVMDFVGGVDLLSVLRARVLPPAVAVAVAIEVASALAEGAASKPTRAHGAIRPDHLLVPVRGGVRVLDPGLTPTPSDCREDVRGLGASLFELLLGAPPGPGLGAAGDPFAPHWEWLGEVDEALPGLLRAMLATGDGPSAADCARRLSALRVPGGTVDDWAEVTLADVDLGGSVGASVRWGTVRAAPSPPAGTIFRDSVAPDVPLADAALVGQIVSGLQAPTPEPAAGPVDPGVSSMPFARPVTVSATPASFDYEVVLPSRSPESSGAPPVDALRTPRWSQVAVPLVTPPARARPSPGSKPTLPAAELPRWITWVFVGLGVVFLLAFAVVVGGRLADGPVAQPVAATDASPAAPPVAVAPPASAHLVVTGAQLMFQGGTGDVVPASLASGSYMVTPVFPDGTVGPAFRLDLDPGARVHLVCDPARGTCLAK